MAPSQPNSENQTQNSTPTNTQYPPSTTTTQTEEEKMSVMNMRMYYQDEARNGPESNARRGVFGLGGPASVLAAIRDWVSGIGAKKA